MKMRPPQKNIADRFVSVRSGLAFGKTLQMRVVIPSAQCAPLTSRLAVFPARYDRFYQRNYLSSSTWGGGRNATGFFATTPLTSPPHFIAERRNYSGVGDGGAAAAAAAERLKEISRYRRSLSLECYFIRRRRA